MHGTDALPAHWVEPLNDLVRSSIMGFDRSRLSDLATRTLRLVGAEAPPPEAPVTEPELA